MNKPCVRLCLFRQSTTSADASKPDYKKPDPFVRQRKSAQMGSRHCQSSAFGGKTHDALAWIGEGEWGSFLFTDGQFTAKLDDALKAKGITEEDWAVICSLLRKGKGRIVVDA